MHSCNPVMMQIAERMGSITFYKYYQAFGYTQKTGIDLPGEALGIFHSPQSLGVTELATSSFGQRFKVSVLGQLCAIATVANDGVPVTPHLISSLQNEKNETVFTYRATQKEAAISKKTAETVAAILEAGVSGDGGAKNAYVSGYHVAAKTGTSEKFEILDAGGNSFLRIGSCVAFAPYDNAEIAVIIVVDEPTSQNKYGSMTAAPYISKYLSAVLPYLGIEKEKSESDLTVDSYVGMDVKAASSALKALGITLEIVGEGNTVLAQVPSEGSVIEREGARVVLYTQADLTYTSVPDAKGKTLGDAMTLFLNAGLNIRITGAVSASSVKTDATVIAQSLSPGTRAERGTAVTLEVYHKNDTD